MSNPIGIGLIGMGTVGTGVAELLQDAPSAMRRGGTARSSSVAKTNSAQSLTHLNVLRQFSR